MAVLLEGAPVARSLSVSIRKNVEKLSQYGVIPTLGTVRIGARNADLAFERGASKKAESLGVRVKHFVLPESVSEAQLVKTLEEINLDASVHGCFLFRPLPEHLNKQAIFNVLLPDKDVDAITTASMGGILTQNEVSFTPCTASACLEILHYYRINPEGKKIAIVGKSITVGLPTALLLVSEEATVSVCHIFTDPEDMKCFCRNADIIISAAGCQGLIKPDYVKKEQIIIDVGINVNQDGKIYGDVDFEHVEPLVSAITPVPSGVGAVTSTILNKHVVEAAMRQTFGEQKT